MTIDTRLRDIVRDTGAVPLGWAGATTSMDYLNWGDSMSPVMIALATSRRIERVPFRSEKPRLAGVGTIGHGFSGGEVWTWGSGCSEWRNPLASPAEREAYRPPADTRLHIAATRGPFSADLLSGGRRSPDVAFGDPVWLMPRFYRPKVEKRYEIGVILHLSELADRGYVAIPRPEIESYRLPEGDTSIKLISTVTPISVDAMRVWIAEVLACKRIVSTSLHGMVVAESYGIPCIPFSLHPGQGLTVVDPFDGVPIDSRMVDLYRSLGCSSLPTYARHHDTPLDWADLMATIDRTWEPKTLDEDRLIARLPMDWNPVPVPATGTVFDHPSVAGIPLQVDLKEFNKQEREERQAARKAARVEARREAAAAVKAERTAARQAASAAAPAAPQSPAPQKTNAPNEPAAPAKAKTVLDRLRSLIR